MFIKKSSDSSKENVNQVQDTTNICKDFLKFDISEIIYKMLNKMKTKVKLNNNNNK